MPFFSKTKRPSKGKSSPENAIAIPLIAVLLLAMKKKEHRQDFSDVEPLQD